MKVLVDSREQRPFTFERFSDVEIVAGALTVGDYSVVGLESLVGIERKELGDLIACLGPERERFERELLRGRGLDWFGVVVEASMEDVQAHRYRSRMAPQAVMQSVLTFSVRYGTHFIWAGDRGRAEYVVHGLLAKYRREMESRLKAVMAAA